MPGQFPRCDLFPQTGASGGCTLSGLGAAADGLDSVGRVARGVRSGEFQAGFVVGARPRDERLVTENRRVLTPDWGRAGCWDRERLNRRSGHRASLLGCRAFSTGLSGHGKWLSIGERTGCGCE